MRRLIVAVTVAFAVPLAGCVSSDEINRINRAISIEWKKQYDQIVAADGVRVYAVDKIDAYRAMAATMKGLGLDEAAVDWRQERITSFGIGPKPLSPAEWQQVEAADLPATKAIVAREAGPLMASLFTFRPEHYRLTFSALMEKVSGGTKVSLDGWLQRIGPSPPGTLWPKDPPPEALRIGVPKIWAHFEQELARMGKAGTRVRPRS